MFEEIESSQVENELLETFGDRFLGDTVRIIQTRKYTEMDEPLIHEALCIILAIYTRKARDGEINTNRIVH